MRSRTGYLVMLNETPIVWASRVQTEIALSTAEAEYAALSSGMRALVPTRHLLFEVAERMRIDASRISLISKAYEDNEAARYIATSDPPKLTARNKHWNIKHHWFRSHLSPDGIQVMPISTTEQLADIFTKSLPRVTFEKFRLEIMGW